jgi:hypothetical protein
MQEEKYKHQYTYDGLLIWIVASANVIRVGTIYNVIFTSHAGDL